MFRFFSEMLYKYLSNNTEDSDKKRKLIMLNSLSLSGSFFLLIMSIILILEKSFFYAAANIFLSILIIIFYFLIYKGYSFIIYSRLIIFIVQLYFIFIFITGAGEQTAFVWVYLYPLIAFFVLDIGTAFVFSMFLICITSIIFIFSAFIPFVIKISVCKLLRIIISYCGVCLFTYIFEKTRLSIQKKYKNTLTELQNLARVDSLTGLYNRRYLDDVIAKIIDQSQRTEIKLGFIMTDIDYFKSYNDNYGHPAGDIILMKYSEMMKLMVKRKTDYIFRYGGEEFLIILFAVDFESLKNISESIISGTEKMEIPHDKSPYRKLTVSAGAVYFETPEIKNLDRIINLADEALYNAKKSGRNCYRIVDFSNKHHLF